MLLGKRQRPALGRTTSMSELSWDLVVDTASVGATSQQLHNRLAGRSVYGIWRRNSGDYAVEMGHFLRACGLCNRSLAPGKDIYMYRGEIAFCSSECRQQQMNLDERKEKCSMSSIKNTTQKNTAGAEASVPGAETIAAA